MDLIDHIRKISFGFFAITGLVHFIAGLMYVNGYFAPESGLINRVSFIPFVIATVTYGLATAKHHLLEYGKDSKKWDWTFITLGGLVFLILLSIELLVIDSKNPLFP